MAIYWPTPGFKGRTFKLCVLTRWDRTLNFCVRSSPLRGHNTKFGNKMRGSLEDIIWTNTTCILNLCCDLDHIVIQFFQRTRQLMMLYSSFGDWVEIIIFWLHKPSLWPWHWRQLTNFSAQHSDSWCCITIPNLVSKGSAVQKISSRHTFTNILNLHCDLDLESSKPISAQDTLAYNVALSNQIWLQTDQEYSR